MGQSQLLSDRETGPARARSSTRRRRALRAPAVHGVRTTPLFGIPLAHVAYDDVIDLVNRVLAVPRRAPLTIDAINTMGMSEGCLDPRMREALLTYDMIVPDGMPLVWCMNAKGATLVDRVYGPYLTDRLLSGLGRRTRVAVIGGFARAHEWLRRTGPSRYPNAEFALLYDAPQGPIDEAYVLECMDGVVRSGAELIFVCLGVPRQYYWTALARPHLQGKVCLSVGGAFDLICGAKRYAPEWIQRAGLTWLHRASQEPRRLGPRYLKYNSAFIWLLLSQELVGRRLAERAPVTS
jgi:N-acetylglucosaminyldiphosphoundecaprenol N-acetyl-beta-D-mannosaminyltransferase